MYAGYPDIPEGNFEESQKRQITDQDLKFFLLGIGRLLWFKKLMTCLKNYSEVPTIFSSPRQLCCTSVTLQRCRLTQAEGTSLGGEDAPVLGRPFSPPFVP